MKKFEVILSAWSFLLTEAERVVVGIEKDAVLTELVRKYGKLIMSVCTRLTGDYFYAEDLTQETFIAAYNALDRFDGVNEKAWLTKIATNKCLDFLKSSAAKTSPASDETLELFRPPGTSPEDEFLEGELNAEIRRACEQLKEPYRSVAVAYYCEEKPLAQLARETGEPLKTIQTRQFRAKKLLQTKLREVLT